MSQRSLALLRSIPSSTRRFGADLVRRPAATALLLLVFAGGLGAGAFAHLVMSGDHHASGITAGSTLHGANSKSIYRHQNADLDAIRDAELAQLRSDGIIKGLLVVAVAMLFTIAAGQVLWFAVASRKEDAHGPT
ncbi:MAG: hypothetical protein ABR600_05550 [Actinomycetota bacterium]